MNKTIQGTALIVAVAIVVGAWLLARSERYRLVSDAPGSIHEVDGWTGRAWYFQDGGKIPLRDSPSIPSIPAREMPLPEAEAAKIAFGDVDYFGTAMGGGIYNGSSWEVNRFVITVTGRNKEGTVVWTRDYSIPTQAPSLTERMFSFDHGREVDGFSAKWILKQAFGIPPKN